MVPLYFFLSYFPFLGFLLFFFHRDFLNFIFQSLSGGFLFFISATLNFQEHFLFVLRMFLYMWPRFMGCHIFSDDIIDDDVAMYFSLHSLCFLQVALKKSIGALGFMTQAFLRCWVSFGCL